MDGFKGLRSPTIYWRVVRWGKGTGKYMPFGDFDNRMGHYTDVDGLRLKMSEMSWYLPEYKIEVVDVFGGDSDEEREQVEARALAITHPDYSLYIRNAVDIRCAIEMAMVGVCPAVRTKDMSFHINSLSETKRGGI